MRCPLLGSMFLSNANLPSNYHTKAYALPITYDPYETIAKNVSLIEDVLPSHRSCFVFTFLKKICIPFLDIFASLVGVSVIWLGEHLSSLFRKRSQINILSSSDLKAPFGYWSTNLFPWCHF